MIKSKLILYSRVTKSTIHLAQENGNVRYITRTGGTVGTRDMRTEELQWDHWVLPNFLVDIESGLYAKPSNSNDHVY